MLGHPQSGSSEGLTPGFHTQTKPLTPDASWRLRHGLQCGLALPWQTRGCPQRSGVPCCLPPEPAGPGQRAELGGRPGVRSLSFGPGRCRPGDRGSLWLSPSEHRVCGPGDLATQAAPPPRWLLTLGSPCRKPPSPKWREPSLNSRSCPQPSCWPDGTARPPPTAPYRVSRDADGAFSSLVSLGSSFALGRDEPVSVEARRGQAAWAAVGTASWPACPQLPEKCAGKRGRATSHRGLASPLLPGSQQAKGARPGVCKATRRLARRLWGGGQRAC